MTPLRGLLCSSLNTPPNFTKRGTGKAGTTSRPLCAVLLGDCGSAFADCCARAKDRPTLINKSQVIATHLTYPFMGIILLIGNKKIQISFQGRPQRIST